jgi:hypothetical protein
MERVLGAVPGHVLAEQFIQRATLLQVTHGHEHRHQVAAAGHFVRERPHQERLAGAEIAEYQNEPRAIGIQPRLDLARGGGLSRRLAKQRPSLVHVLV